MPAIRLPNLFRTLRYRNYRLFFSGQLVSLIGTWMQTVALTWLVYRMTSSAFLLGIVGFAGQLPSFLLGPFAGVLVDRFNRHRVILLTQISAMLQAGILAWLTLAGQIDVWHIVALSILSGFINAFDMPARQAFVVEMIEDRNDLSNAIALNSSMFNGARLIGPAVAGLTIAALGEGLCFLLNAVSYVAVIAALLSMRIGARPKVEKSRPLFAGLVEGFRYAYGFMPIRSILLLISVMSLFGMPYTVLMPVFARDVLHGGPDTLGILMGAVGVGAMTGALILAARKTVRGLSRWIVRASFTFGIGLIMFSLSTTVLLSALLLLFVGLGMMAQMASSNTILQTIVDDDKRGRVMSFYVMSFVGTAPFGSLLAGAAADRIGAPLTVALSGCACVVAALVFSRALPGIRKEMRPIYVRKGIVPEVSTGVSTASELTTPPEG